MAQNRLAPNPFARFAGRMPPARPPEHLDAGPVVLDRVRLADGLAIRAAVTASLDHLSPWMPWATPAAMTEEGHRPFLEEAERTWDDGTSFAYALRRAGDPSAVVGTCGLHRRIGPGGIEIGYWVHVDHVGKGWATAAARALTEAAIALADVDRVEIHCDEANVRSAAVPLALGYRLDRVEEDGIQAPGEVGRSLVWVRGRGTPA